MEQPQSHGTLGDVLLVLSWVGTGATFLFDHAEAASKVVLFLLSVAVSISAITYYRLSIKKLKNEKRD